MVTTICFVDDIQESFAEVNRVLKSKGLIIMGFIDKICKLAKLYQAKKGESKTRHIFGEDELKAMEKTAYLINTARGSIINEKALYKALEDKWIAGAALDVMEKEPPDWENPVLKLNNLIITPHISFYSEESFVDLKTKTAEAVLSVLKGELPGAMVNPQVIKK